MEDARQCYNTIKNTGALLGGERNAVKIEGFHLANSPFEYTREVVEGKTIILTTSNGTRALIGSRGANNITIASFLNATAVANWLGNEGENVAIVCAGSAESYTLEDALCAGMGIMPSGISLTPYSLNNRERMASSILALAWWIRTFFISER